MSKRVTIVFGDKTFTKLHQIQGEAITKSGSSISFSDVINFGIDYAIAKGYNVSYALKGKETKTR